MLTFGMLTQSTLQLAPAPVLVGSHEITVKEELNNKMRIVIAIPIINSLKISVVKNKDLCKKKT